MEQFSSLRLYPRCHLILMHDLKPHLLHHVQIIIKGTSGLRCHRDGIASQGMIARCPMARSTSHSYACQQKGLTALSRMLNSLGNNNSWTRHNHLKAILNGFTTLEEQDILGAS